MSAHRKKIERRPLYAALTLALVSVAVILAFGATAQNSPSIFNSTRAQADVAPSVISAARPSLIPLPGPAVVTPRASVTAPRATSGSVAPTPFASSYHPVLTAHSQASLVVSTPAPPPPSQAVSTKRPSIRVTSPAKPKPVTSHLPRPTSQPTTHPTPRPATRPTTPGGAGGSGDGSQLPWWWYLVPHPPTFPRVPVATHTYSLPASGGTISRHESGSFGSRHRSH